MFVLVTLISEAVLLFVAAQTGFLDGPRVLANMSLDRWLPSQFSLLSERLVIKNGILLMGGAALVLMLVEPRLGRVPDRALRHQRLHHLLPLPGGHGPALVAGAEDGRRLEDGRSSSTASACCSRASSSFPRSS